MTQEQAIQDYLDLTRVRITMALAQISAELADKTLTRPPAVRQVALKHAHIDNLKVIAAQRWYASNPPETRNLPHVLLALDRIVDRTIEPRALVRPT